MKNEKNLTEKAKNLKPTTADVGHKVVSGSLSAVPVLGPIAATLWSFIAPPLQKRQTDFFNDVAQSIDKLRGKIDNLETFDDLVKNDHFQTTLAKSMQVVSRTHSEEKKKLLKNIVLNSVIETDQSEDETTMFLDYIDRFTMGHIALLSFCDDPKMWFEKRKIKMSIISGGLSTLIERAFDYDKEIYEQFIRDLHNAGLLRINTQGLNTTLSQSGLYASRTTETGKRFIEFVADQGDENTHS